VETRTILVVQTGKIGDLVCTTPLFRELRKSFPQAHIVLALHPVNRALAAQLPFFDQLLEIPSGSLSGWRNKWFQIRQIRKLQPDLAVCCSGGLAWPFILAMSGIPKRLGLTPNFMGRSTRLAQGLWTDSVLHDGNELIGSSYGRLLAVLGCHSLDMRKEVRAISGAEQSVAEFLNAAGCQEDMHLGGVAISAANKLKELGLPLLEGVCRKMLEKDPALRIVLLGGEGDRSLAIELIKTLASPHVMDSCGVFSLDVVPALLQRLDVFVGVDSGLTYMADSLDIPLVSLAGPCNMRETRPVNQRVIILQEKLPCVPCAHIFKAPYSCRIGTRACIANVSPDQIADAALHLLAEKHKHAG
jgi:ADP-heptose:LPS heptosyltransferase